MRQETPGFIAVFFDIPFPTSVPNGSYVTFDPAKGIGVVTLTLREGSRAFFRNRPIVGPTSFEELQRAWQEPQRPREGYSYVAVSKVNDGREKATLNVQSGPDGGYAECKYYTEVCVTYLSDDLGCISSQNVALARACDILNPFLDKYRLITEDYRVSRVSLERNFYFGTCHTSPLTPEELPLSAHELFEKLQQPRTFQMKLGYGAANILRTNSFELLGPRSPLVGTMLQVFNEFVKEEYILPLSYELILDSLASLQRARDYRLAIVHAETAVEVHVRGLLLKLMAHFGMTQQQADQTIDNDDKYWGVKKKIKRLDDWTSKYCTSQNAPFAPFVGSTLCSRWEADLYGARNAAVHAGASGFTYAQASAAIGIAKECIIEMEAKIPSLQNRVQLSPSMTQFRLNPGEVMF
jgi:hypothetical protein